MKNLGQMMKQAQQMQAKMAEMQAELETVEMTGASGGGLVQVTVGGKGDLRKIKLDKSLLDPAEVEVLEDLIVAVPPSGLAMPAGAGNDRARIYLVDPHGNVMMRWPAQPDFRRMLNDLERLLKASQIG